MNPPGQNTTHKDNYKQAPRPNSLSSSLDPKRAQRETLERLQIRLDLESLKLGLNDLLPLAQEWDGSLDELAESLEHIVYYLRSPEASRLKSPKAWLLKHLRAGYYGAPANFLSWQERRDEAKLRARQQQAERRQQQRIQLLQADFDLWLADLTETERRNIFEASVDLKPEFVTPSMQLNMLRTHLAQLRGAPEFLAIDPAPGPKPES